MASNPEYRSLNPINGYYSVGARGLWIEGGQTKEPVTGFTVAGDVLDMIKNVAAVPDDLGFVPIAGSIGGPTMIVKGMTLGGRQLSTSRRSVSRCCDR